MRMFEASSSCVGREQSRTSDVPVVLVVPPVINATIPALGTAVLAASCTRAGIPTRIHYANVTFAARVGFGLCMRFASAPPQTMLGEAIFWGAAFPERAERHRHILEALTRLEDPSYQIERLPFPSLSELLDCVAAIPGFLAETAEKLLSFSPRIIGFSSMCHQTFASIAIAAEIKRRRPDILTVLGGVNASEPMGSALMEITDAFDFVFSGEGDIDFPAFCRAYLDRGELPAERLVRCAPVGNLDQAANPDYDDYFADIAPLREKYPLTAEAPHRLVFESSRGCWWADQQNCSFCGFNTPGARFRTKSPERVVDELDHLTARYGLRHMFASDAIMARELPSTTLTRLAERGLDCSFSYEVKSNLGEKDLDICASAGVIEIQPGIESLSSHVLRLMSKGVKALENVRLLRDAGSRGLDVIWNFLTHIPGETREDYERMIELIPLLEHLRAPTRWGPVRISRCSPYHRDPARYGIRSLRPWPAYVEFYGDRAERLSRNFLGDYETGFTRNPDLTARFHKAIRGWADAWLRADGPPELFIRTLNDGRVVVRDTRAVARAGKQGIHLLSPEMVSALEAVRRPASIDQVPDKHRAVLDRLVSLGLVARHEGELLALPIEPVVGERLEHERRIRLSDNEKTPVEDDV